MNRPGPDSDCVEVGASFAGPACASALAGSGMRVKVLEKKGDSGEKLHTTGIIVKDAVDQVGLARRVRGGRRAGRRLRHSRPASP